VEVQRAVGLLQVIVIKITVRTPRHAE
jgi:hypothetical protein